MTIPEARAVIDPNTPAKDVLIIGEKYMIGPSETVLQARRIATRLLKYSLGSAPRIELYEGGERAAFCPNCDAEITEGGGNWEYCPFCGQAVNFPEEW